MEQLTLSNIVQTLIVNLIALVLIWIGKKYGTKAVRFFSSINKAYSRKIHKEAAKGYTNKIIVVFFYVIVLFVVMTSTIICNILWDTPTLTTSKISTISDKILTHFAGFTIIICNILLLEFYLRQNLINNNIADFNYKLKIIRPNINTETYNLLQQKWALMESENDYKKIKEELYSYLKDIEGYKSDRK